MGRLISIPTKPRPPAGLSKAAKEFWTDVRDEYQISDAGGLRVLEIAARAFARLDEARRLLDREGLVIRDRWNQPKPHPAAQVERDARSGLLRALASLHLDVEPVQNRLGRPGG